MTRRKTPEERTERQSPRSIEAADWIMEMLRHGPAKSSELFAEAIAQGISEITYYRVRKALEVKSRRVGGFQGGHWESFMEDWPIPKDQHVKSR